MTELDRELIRNVAALLDRAESALFITGSGLSADSGLPTFRGISGLYEVSDQEDGYPIEVAFSGQMLELRPEIAWKHIARAEAACRKAQANRGHEVIAALQERIDRVWVFTQNVDGLHGLAGSRNVLEMNGNLHHLACMGCGEWKTVKDYAGMNIPPVCQSCARLVRPEIVLFGEMASTRVLDRMVEEMEDGFDVIVLVGTSALHPDVKTSLEDSRIMGTPIIEIGMGNSEISDIVDYLIEAKAVVALEAVWDEL
jgi:NAD-dependent deacetylase